MLEVGVPQPAERLIARRIRSQRALLPERLEEPPE
jgi:hypothetical protein